MSWLLDLLTISAATLTALASGLYLAFTTMVMPALNQSAPAHAVDVMRKVNVWAVRPPFMVIFFGSAMTALATGIGQLVGVDGREASIPALIGAVLALLSFGVTVVRNIPLNNQLARTDDSDRSAARKWEAFSGPWSAANLIRALLGTVATIALAYSLI